MPRPAAASSSDDAVHNRNNSTSSDRKENNATQNAHDIPVIAGVAAEPDVGFGLKELFINITKAYMGIPGIGYNLLHPLLKTSPGTGILAIPWALQKAGFVCGVVSIALCCFILNHTMKLLIRMKLALEDRRKMFSPDSGRMGAAAVLREDSEEQNNGGTNGNQSNGNRGDPLLDRNAYYGNVTHASRDVPLRELAPGTTRAKNSSNDSESSNIDSSSTDTNSNNRRNYRNRTGQRAVRGSSPPSPPPNPIGYDEIAGFCYGKTGKVLIKLALFATNVGISVGYLCIIGENLTAIWAGNRNTDNHTRDNAHGNSESDDTWATGIWNFTVGGFHFHFNILLMAVFPILVFLCSLKMDRLAVCSILGNIAVLATVLIVVWCSVEKLVAGGNSGNTNVAVNQKVIVNSSSASSTGISVSSSLDNSFLPAHNVAALSSSTHTVSDSIITSSQTLAQRNLNHENSIAGLKSELEPEASSGSIFPSSALSSALLSSSIAPITIFSSSYPRAFGIFLFSFVMHGVVLGQHQATKPTRRARAPLILDLAAAFVAFVYIAYSAIAYLAYAGGNAVTPGKHDPASENEIAQNILDAVRAGVSGWRSICVQSADALLCLAVLGSIPLFMDEVFSQLGMGFSPENSLSRTAARSSHKVCIVILRAQVLAVLLFVALLLGTDFADVLSLVGALSMSWLGCILPGLFYIQFAKKMGAREGFNLEEHDISTNLNSSNSKHVFKLKSFDGILTMACAVCGFAGMLCGTYESIRHMVDG